MDLTACPKCKKVDHVSLLPDAADMFGCSACCHAWRVLVPAKAAVDAKAGTALALFASDAMAHLVSAVRVGDEEKAVVYAEQITHALSKLLAGYGIELGEVLPLTTCSRCKRPCIEYRRYGSERVCVVCIHEHVTTIEGGTPADTSAVIAHGRAALVHLREAKR